MAERKQLNTNLIFWRIEALLYSVDQELAARQTFEARPESPEIGILHWHLLKRENDRLIYGYRIVRGQDGGLLEVAPNSYFRWAPLRGISQQDCLNAVFDKLKELNAAEAANA